MIIFVPSALSRVVVSCAIFRTGLFKSFKLYVTDKAQGF